MKGEKRSIRIKNMIITWLIIFCVMILVYSIASYLGAKQYEATITENILTISQTLQNTFLNVELTRLSETTNALIAFTIARIAAFALLSLFATVVLIVVLNSYFYTRRIVLIDPLTELYNKRYFYLDIDKEIARAKRYKHPLSLIILDIDDFKIYNDRYGHAAGDDLLRTLGTILKKSVREIDSVVRYGGEEFCIVLPEAKHEDAVAIAESIRNRIEHYNFGRGKKVTISLGLITYKSTKAYPKKEEIVRRADALLYAAKSKGKNIVEKQNIEIGKKK